MANTGGAETAIYMYWMFDVCLIMDEHGETMFDVYPMQYICGG
jgi:hypothetical protein